METMQAHDHSAGHDPHHGHIHPAPRGKFLGIALAATLGLVIAELAVSLTLLTGAGLAQVTGQSAQTWLSLQGQPVRAMDVAGDRLYTVAAGQSP